MPYLAGRKEGREGRGGEGREGKGREGKGTLAWSLHPLVSCVYTVVVLTQGVFKPEEGKDDVSSFWKPKT